MNKINNGIIIQNLKWGLINRFTGVCFFWLKLSQVIYQFFGFTDETANNTAKHEAVLIITLDDNLDK